MSRVAGAQIRPLVRPLPDTAAARIRRRRDDVRTPTPDPASGFRAMLAGDLARARLALAAADTPEQPARSGLDPSRWLLTHATAVGLARRDGDQRALVRHWRTGQAIPADTRTVSDHRGSDHRGPDQMAAVGELWLAATRLRDIGRVARLVRETGESLGRHGDPTDAAAVFHWYGVQAAILAGRPTAVVPHAAALRSAADRGTTGAGRYPAVFNAAGRAWVRTLSGDVDAREVTRCANQLGGIGQGWAGARLAADAAIRTTDPADGIALVRVAVGLTDRAPRSISS